METRKQDIKIALPEETLAIAEAIANRTARYEELTEKVTAEIMDTPYQPSTEEVRQQRNLGRTVMLMTRVEDPSIPITLRDMAEKAWDGEHYDDISEAVSLTTGSEVDSETFKQIQFNFLDGVQSSSNGQLGDDKITENFARLLSSARALAEETDKPVAEIYDNDELYYEAARRAFPTEDQIASYSTLINSTGDEAMNKVMLNIFDTLLPQEIRDSMSQEELDEMSAELHLDPEVSKAVSMVSSKMQEIVRQMFVYHFSKMYGIDKLKDLSVDEKKTLMPRMRLAPSLTQSFDA